MKYDVPNWFDIVGLNMRYLVHVEMVYTTVQSLALACASPLLAFATACETSNQLKTMIKYGRSSRWSIQLLPFDLPTTLNVQQTQPATRKVIVGIRFNPVTRLTTWKSQKQHPGGRGGGVIGSNRCT